MKRFLVCLFFILSVVPLQAGAQTRAGTITAASSTCSETANSTACVVFSNVQPDHGVMAVQVSGTFTGTLNFEGVINGTTAGYGAASCTPLASGTAVSSATAGGRWQCLAAGINGFRVRASAMSAGAAIIALVSADSSLGSGASGSGGGAVTVADGADVALGTTTDNRCTTTDTTACTIVGLEKQLNYLVSTATGPTTAANANSVVVAYNTLASGAVTSAMTGTTSTSVIGGTASNYIYVAWCVVSNASLTVSTDILLQDGSGGTTLAVLPAPAATVATTGGGGGMFPFPKPLKVPTSGNALYAANVTTGSSTKISCGGEKSTISY